MRDVSTFSEKQFCISSYLRLSLIQYFIVNYTTTRLLCVFSLVVARDLLVDTRIDDVKSHARSRQRVEYRNDKHVTHSRCNDI